ncbi:MAG: PspA/IM30 family protein [Bacillaceae bacterium]|nr:PspA/IM30 family protein [Bacillaceae bacterium]
MVFKRISDMVKATIHEGLDQMENPLVMINQYLRDMENEIMKARQSITRQKTLQKSFQIQMTDADKMAEKRAEQARIAFDAGEEELARKALIEKKHYEKKKEHYTALYNQATEQVEKLEQQLAELQDQFEQMRDRKYALVARANAARTREHINHSLDKFNIANTIREFQRMEERILEMEIRAETAGSRIETCESGLSKLEINREVEEELEQMRQERDAEKKSGTDTP